MDNVLRKLSEVKLEKMSYLWHDRLIMGTRFNLIAGPSGKGKSMATAKMAADVSTGRGMPNGKPAAVIFSNMEDAPSVSRARIEAAGGDIDRIHVPSMPYLIPDDIERLEADIIRLGAKLIVLDTANKHITAPSKNDQKIAAALLPLTQMVERTKCALVFVTHTLKSVSRSQDPLLAVGGAVGGLVGSAATVALFGVDPTNEENRAMAWVKNSYGPNAPGMRFSIESVEVYDDRGRVASTAGVLHIEDREADIDPIDLVAGKSKKGEDTDAAPKRAEAAEWLSDRLANGPVKVTELQAEAENLNLSWTGAIRRAAKQIEVEKVPVGAKEQRVWWWRLPFGHPKLNPAVDNKVPGAK